MVTALKMTDSELTHRACVLAERHRARAAGSSGPARDILVKVRDIAELLRKQYGAETVMLFGSAVQGGRWWKESSDVDLAVKGIEGREFWQAYAAIEGMVPGHRIDLVDIDMATESLKAAIIRYGVKL